MAPPSELVLERWDAAAERGVLRTSATAAQWRVVPGDLHVLVTFNPLHRANKRPVAAELAAPLAEFSTAPVSQLRPPATSGGFDFTKAKPNEFLCGLDASAALPAELAIEETLDDDGCLASCHAVLVNVSPLMRGHSLFVFDWRALHPQSLTLEMLRLAAGVGPLVARDDFALGFNSAGAWSSVNHCHFQGYWMNEAAPHSGSNQFPVVEQPRQLCFNVTVGSSVVSVSCLPRWPARCFAIEPATAIPDGSDGGVVQVTWKLIQLLQTQGIPHNLLLIWRPRLLAIVFPRQLQRENGVGRFSDESQQLRYAIAEVAGLVVAGGEAMFSEVTQSVYEDIMRHEISLDEVSFSCRVESLKQCTLI